MNVTLNTLFTNDNLFVLNGMNSECVDLIYLDPPFNSKRFYSAPIGSKAAGASFKDMWSWDDVDSALLVRLTEKHPQLVQFIQSIEKSHGRAMMAYIAFMAQRIFELHRILKPSGSFYLHCDPTAGHYLRVLLDAVFGNKQFRNEIVWFYPDTPGRPTRDFPRKHDLIMRYVKNAEHGSGWVFNADEVRVPILPASVQRYKTPRTLGGRAYTGGLAATKGKIPESVWQIPAVKRNSKESSGYPTQKPLALLKRIVRASSNEGDVVLDPFCGCATTLVAAQHLRRKWIGIDIEEKSGDIVRERLTTDVGGVFNDFTHRRDLPQRTEFPAANPRDTEVRKRLFGDQGGRCNGCKSRFDPHHLETDHIIPKNKGGGDFYENFQLLCGNCNRIKGDRPMDYLISVIKNRESQRTIFG